MGQDRVGGFMFVTYQNTFFFVASCDACLPVSLSPFCWYSNFQLSGILQINFHAFPINDVRHCHPQRMRENEHSSADTTSLKLLTASTLSLSFTPHLLLYKSSVVSSLKRELEPEWILFCGIGKITITRLFTPHHK